MDKQEREELLKDPKAWFKKQEEKRIIQTHDAVKRYSRILEDLTDHHKRQIKDIELHHRKTLIKAYDILLEEKTKLDMEPDDNIEFWRQMLGIIHEN